jgi:hypothetical protein
LWFADIVVDLQWFISREGKLGRPRARAPELHTDTIVRTEVALYGDDVAIRHVRIIIETDDEIAAHACVDGNIHRWVNALEISSVLTTPTVSTAAILQKNSAAFMVFMGNGGIDADSVALTLNYAPQATADFSAAAAIMTSWKADFRVHLFYISRFLNHTLPPEVRWLNGYRVLEWHFMQGKVGLAGSEAYRAFLDRQGAALDASLKQNQSRYGLIEEVRAQAAHAILSRTADPRNDDGSTSLILKTFPALESLVMKLMNEGTNDAVTFKALAAPSS